MTAHIESNKEDVSDLVLMPGDPLRAKYIADNYLENVKVINTIRNMLAYTGYYKNKKITVFPSGMGIPSMGIYAYELYKFYDVNKIIRIGTCGGLKEDLKVFDVILADSAYSTSSFAKLFNNSDDKDIKSSPLLTNKIKEVAINHNIPIHCGRIMTSEVFDVYVDYDLFIKNYPSEKEYLASEMEAFALFHLANSLNKEAACLLTVVDTKFDKRVVTPEERQKSLDQMITLALESII